jgi:hypothetical protein
MAFLYPKSFPFCIPTEKQTQSTPVGSGTLYPIGMSLEDAMALFWKSKTFSFSQSLNLNFLLATLFPDADPSLGFSWSPTGSASGTLVGPSDDLWPSKMSEMICGDYTNYNIPLPHFYGGQSFMNPGFTRVLIPDIGGILTVDEPFDSNHIFLEMFFLPTAYGDRGPPVIRRGEKYYPRILVDIAGRNQPFAIPIAGKISSVPHVVSEFGFESGITLPDALTINGYKADLYAVMGFLEFTVNPTGTGFFTATGNNDRLAE